MVRAEYPEKKKAYFKRMNEYLNTYNKIMVVACDNVQSKQMQDIRLALRGKGEMLCGKNTMMKKLLAERLASDNSDANKSLHQKFVNERLIQGNIGLIFVKDDLKEAKDIIEANKVQAPARQGTVAPVEVTVPAGNTGLEPTKTSFFQALGIPTKITKGTVEILKDQLIIKVGDKVGSSEAALLQMLDIKPFFYGLGIQHVYDAGSVYGPQVLNLTDEDMKEKFQAGISNLTALSLGLGYPTQASLPHVILNGFKDALAISVVTDYEFDEFKGKELKDAILNGPKGGFAPSGGGGGGGGGSAAPAAAAAAAKEPEKEDEEDDDMGMGLFD